MRELLCLCERERVTERESESARESERARRRETERERTRLARQRAWRGRPARVAGAPTARLATCAQKQTSGLGGKLQVLATSPQKRGGVVVFKLP